jgi:hypothetical protein
MLGALFFVKPMSVFFATMAAAAFAVPFDNARTKYMHMLANEAKYMSQSHVINKSAAVETFMGLYTGYWAFVAHKVPHAIVLLYTVDFLQPKFFS